MAIIVPTTEEDPALSIVRFVSELTWADAGSEVAEPQVASLCQEAQECMVAGRWLDLASLILTSAELVFSKVAEKDVECIYTVICNLVTKSENLDEVLEIVKLVCAKIAQQPNEKPASAPEDIVHLYNLLEDSYSRFYVYLKALNLASSGKVTEHVIPSIKKIEHFMKEWNLGESFNFLVKYLATFSPEDEHAMVEAKEEAANAIIEFVKAPDMFQCDLLDMPSVSQLENDAKYSLLYQLLKIFLTQRLDAYLDFQAANSAFLKSYGLVHEDCLAKMRLLSLVDLASSESGQVPYALIKDTLKVNENEVEYWVVKAITAKLLDCKMDQMNQVVIVSRCTERLFGLQQWENLRSKLVTWRGNIAGVINTIQANKVAEDTTQAMQSMTVR
ncbi:Eukaryotic translation initiation factor 3 subunit M [Bienertia sinuspersici]